MVDELAVVGDVAVLVAVDELVLTPPEPALLAVLELDPPHAQSTSETANRASSADDFMP